MKKLLLVLLFLLCLSEGYAQHYRFYGGIQAGPKLSFSNLVLPGQNDFNYRSYSKIRDQKGIVAGYNFRNNRLSLEAGYSLHSHSVTIKFWDHPDFGETPELWYDFTGDQAALLSKMTLNDPESKVIFRAVVGGAYFMKWGKNKSSFRYSQEGDRFGFIAYPYAETPDREFGFRPGDAFELDFAPNVWLVQAGCEAQANLTRNIAVNVSAIYQTSLQPVEVWSFRYSYHYHRGVVYVPELPGSTFSKAEALNFNLGLFYCFSRRD